jgi:hypothetical protein
MRDHGDRTISLPPPHVLEALRRPKWMRDLPLLTDRDYGTQATIEGAQRLLQEDVRQCCHVRLGDKAFPGGARPELLLCGGQHGPMVQPGSVTRAFSVERLPVRGRPVARHPR